MSRRGQAPKRLILPDSRFGDVSVQRFINKLMMRGKKGHAEQIMYDALQLCEERAKRPAMSSIGKAYRTCA